MGRRLIVRRATRDQHQSFPIKRWPPTPGFAFMDMPRKEEARWMLHQLIRGILISDVSTARTGA